MRSIDRYDPYKGATLEQFAWTRIHGAVLDELRRNDWAPRSLRRWDRDINRAREQFIGLYGRAPSAGARGRRDLSQELIAGSARSRSDVGSLNMLVLGEDDTTIERIDTLHSKTPTPIRRARGSRSGQGALPQRLRAATRA